MSIQKTNPRRHPTLEYVEVPGAMITIPAARALAVLRISTGSQFTSATGD